MGQCRLKGTLSSHLACLGYILVRGAFVQTNLKVASLRLSPLGRVSVDTFHCVDVSKHKVGQGFVIGDISKSGVESREELGEFGLPVIVRRRDEPFITTHSERWTALFNR